jgi:hypothetical protein
MRTVVPIAVFLALGLNAIPVCASHDSSPPTLESVQALEARANQASPRDQCFLYAELVQQMTELSIQQYSTGETTKATGLLKQIQKIAAKIHFTITGKDKRLKNAQLLLSRTAFRLGEMLHSSSYEDRSVVQQTLAQVTKAQNATMMELFQH